MQTCKFINLHICTQHWFLTMMTSNFFLGEGAWCVSEVAVLDKSKDPVSGGLC